VIDFVIGIVLAGLAVRGWMRGLVRALLDLVGLILGAALAFRLSAPVGDFLTDRFGVTSEWARLGAGAVLLVGVGVGLALLAGLLTRVMRLPGLNFANRLGGAAFAAAWGILFLTILVALVGVLPVGGLGEALASSRIVGLVTGRESLPGRVLATVAGRPVAQVIGALEELIGDRRVLVDGEERVELEPVAPAEYARDPAAAREMLQLVNATRLAAGADPLPWSADLSAVAAMHAEEMYREGYVSAVSPSTGLVADRLAAAGLTLQVVSENIGLAATTRAVHEELSGSAPHRARLISGAVDRVGIGVVAGPYGVMVVEILGG
jgi:uncharacterized membrane protein required for colicin V production